MTLLWPPPVHQLVNYIAHLSSNFTSFSTEKCYWSGYQRQLQGHVDYTELFMVRKMLEGMHRLHPSKDIRAPKTFPILALSSVCSNSYEATLFTTAFELAFFALLRVSEFTVSSKSSVVLHKSDVQLSATYLQVIIKGSKTDLLGKDSIIHIFL